MSKTNWRPAAAISRSLVRSLDRSLRIDIHQALDLAQALAVLTQLVCTFVATRTLDPISVKEALFEGSTYNGGSVGQQLVKLLVLSWKWWLMVVVTVAAGFWAGLAFAAFPYLIMSPPIQPPPETP